MTDEVIDNIDTQFYHTCPYCGASCPCLYDHGRLEDATHYIACTKGCLEADRIWTDKHRHHQQCAPGEGWGRVVLCVAEPPITPSDKKS